MESNSDWSAGTSAPKSYPCRGWRSEIEGARGFQERLTNGGWFETSMSAAVWTEAAKIDGAVGCKGNLLSLANSYRLDRHSSNALNYRDVQPHSSEAVSVENGTYLTFSTSGGRPWMSLRPARGSISSNKGLLAPHVVLYASIGGDTCYVALMKCAPAVFPFEQSSGN